MDRVLTALMTPDRLYTANSVLSKPCPVPEVHGVYACYFRQAPGETPVRRCHVVDDMPLLYLGFAPAREVSGGNLQSRIRAHYIGKAEFSTLRLSIGSLLAQQLDLRLYLTGKAGSKTYGDGEERLSAWMRENMLMVWAELQRPWALVPDLIARLAPPLNLTHNTSHPFRARLSALRCAQRESARRAG